MGTALSTPTASSMMFSHLHTRWQTAKSELGCNASSTLRLGVPFSEFEEHVLMRGLVEVHHRVGLDLGAVARVAELDHLSCAR